MHFKLRTVDERHISVHLEVLIVPKLGADLFSVGALEEKGVRLNLLRDPPVLEFDNKVFPVSKEIKRMFVLPVIIAKEKEKVLATVQDESETWHRRLGHCNVRTLKQLTERQGSGIKLSANIQNLDCQVCAVSKNKKISHPRSDRPRSSRRLEVVHADLWGPHATVHQM